jgi:hypothetical protein
MRYSKPVSALVIFIAIIALIPSASSQIRPVRGIDSYGQGLSYPGAYLDPPLGSLGNGISSVQPLYAVNMNHDLRLLSIWMVPGYVPVPVNLSGQGWHMERIYGQFPSAAGSILPKGSIEDERNIPAVTDFTNPNWKPEEVDYQIPAFKEFMDEGWQSETGHHQPDLNYEPGSGDYSPGLTDFLNDGDRVPKRPLL